MSWWKCQPSALLTHGASSWPLVWHSANLRHLHRIRKELLWFLHGKCKCGRCAAGGGLLFIQCDFSPSQNEQACKSARPARLAGEVTKKHSPPRTCAARSGLSVEKRGKKTGVRTTGHLRAGSKCSLQTDTHLCTDWVITQNTQSIYTLLQGCGWLAQGTKMSVKPKDKTYRSGGLRPLVLHVARLTCILLYEGVR